MDWMWCVQERNQTTFLEIVLSNQANGGTICGIGNIEGGESLEGVVEMNCCMNENKCPEDKKEQDVIY